MMMMMLIIITSRDGEYIYILEFLACGWCLGKFSRKVGWGPGEVFRCPNKVFRNPGVQVFRSPGDLPGNLAHRGGFQVSRCPVC